MSNTEEHQIVKYRCRVPPALRAQNYFVNEQLNYTAITNTFTQKHVYIGRLTK